MHVKQLDFIFFTESGDGAGPSNQEAGQSQAEGSLEFFILFLNTNLSINLNSCL